MVWSDVGFFFPGVLFSPSRLFYFLVSWCYCLRENYRSDSHPFATLPAVTCWLLHLVSWCRLSVAISGSLSGYAVLGTATPEERAYSPFCHLCCRALNRTGDTRYRLLSALVELCCLSENAEHPAKPGPRGALKDPADVTKLLSVWSSCCLQEVLPISLWVQPGWDSTSTLDSCFLIKQGGSSWILKSLIVCYFKPKKKVTIIISAGQRLALYHSRHVLLLLDECGKWQTVALVQS